MYSRKDSHEKRREDSIHPSSSITLRGANSTLTSTRFVRIETVLGAKVETDPVSDAEPRGPLPTFLKTSASVDRPYVRSHSPVRARVHARVRGRRNREEREREDKKLVEVEKVVESLGRVCVAGERGCTERERTLLEVGGSSRVSWAVRRAIDASTPRITPRFLNVHLLFLHLVLPRPSSPSLHLLRLFHHRPTTSTSRFVSSSVPVIK